MATLFNTKISATYEGLLKTIDNAAITATLKELTDGSGNQSGLYLNTAGDFKVSSVLEWGSLKDTGTGVTITQFVTSTDGIENFNNNTTIPTSAAVKSYVDANGGGLAGSGTTNFISKWSNATTLADSQLFDNGTNIGIGTVTPSAKLEVNGTFLTTNNGTIEGRTNLKKDLIIRGTDALANQGVARFYVDSSNKLFIDTSNDGSNLFCINETGNVGINTTSPSEKLEVNGNLLVTGTIIGSGGSFLPLAGGTMTGNTIHNDNVRSIYGTSSDLEIYHDGSNSYITEAGTGDLYIAAATNFFVRNAANGEVWIKGTDAGVSLRYQDSQKLITTATGVSVTGNGIFTDSVGISTTNPISKLTVNEIGTTNAAVSIVTARYGISLQGAGTSNSQYLLNLQSDGGSTDVMRVQSSGNVGIGITSPSQKLDIDGNVRISSERYYYTSGTGAGFGSDASGNFKIRQNDADLIFGSGNNVGIGITAPAEKLDVNGNIRVKDEGEIYIKGSTNSRKIVRLDNTGDKGLITLNRTDVTRVVISADFNNGGHTYFNGSNTNVGIGLTNPTSKLEVEGGNIKITDTSAGLILTSQDGTVYKINVANDGTLTSTAV